MNNVLKIEGINYQFEEHPVLQDVNMVVKPQETVGILGTSGVGKTTIFNLIASNLELQTLRVISSACHLLSYSSTEKSLNAVVSTVTLNCWQILL